MATKSGDQGLRDWFGKSKSKDGKKGWVNVVTGDSCASDKPGEGIPKCVSSAKRASMSKKERLAAAAAKRREDPGQQQKSGASKPTMVKTDRKTRKEEMEIKEGIRDRLRGVAKAVKKGVEQEKKFQRASGETLDRMKRMTRHKQDKYGPSTLKQRLKTGADHDIDAEKKAKMKEEVEIAEAKDKPGKGSGKKDACYHKVKSRYSVWPSAYASGALVKCRKVGAANWGNKSEEFSNWREELNLEEGQKCWPGYEKKGTKKMFGKTYNNCVKKEEFEKEVPSGDIKKLVKKAVKRIDQNVSGHVDKKDKSMGEYGEFVPSVDGKKKVVTSVKREQFSDWRSELGEGVMPAAIDPKAHRKQQRAAKVRNLAQKGATEGERAAAERKTKGPKMFGEDWQKVNKKDKTDGMSAAAVKAYRRENPGSKLKTAVTGDPKPGSKDAKRRKSFCARSKGQQDMHNIDCSKDPDKPVCKARRRWKC